MKPNEQAYWESLSGVDWTLSIILVLANLTAAMTLLLLRKIAFYLFSGALASNLLMTIWHVVTKDFVSAVGGPTATGLFLGLGIIVAVCLYTWKLTRVGILR